jgi:hypothetical protein
MSQSINSDKSVSCIKIEYHSGSRNSKQILYNNNLFGHIEPRRGTLKRLKNGGKCL